MRTFLANDKNDLARAADGNLKIISGIEAIAQTCKEAMQTRLREMIHAQTSGIPFDPVLWDGAPNAAQFEASGRVRLMQVPGVLEVISFQARLINNTMGYVATIRTTEGETTING
jgi:hypothetical protein